MAGNETEPLLCAAVEEAIRQGYLLISQDWGVAWNTTTKLWQWDPSVFWLKSCCIIGAYLLTCQPELDARLHKGDPHTAALLLLQCDQWWLRDFINGADGEPQHEGHDQDVYGLGMRMRKAYLPLSVDILALQKYETRPGTTQNRR